ncbi:cytochrome c oxidase subunit 3 [Acidocella sp.]|uniref:cytochrome c oxidase subunit 3 n=1 Tax=Acidocella sp. TaxID=50710 RepID=UPI0026219563|nr:cytochrome c oxidase subunit 3 [Acidocella sp.]
MAHETMTADAAVRLWNAEADEHDPISARTYGFWLYLMSDGLIFASLIAAYAVLDNKMSAFGHPMADTLLSASQGFVQTLVLLGAVLALSLGTLGLKTGARGGLALGLAVSAALGTVFVAQGLAGLDAMAAAGNGPTASAYLSCLFVLLFTHGLHLAIGVLWSLVMLVQIFRFGFTQDVVGRLLNLRLYTQFQAAVWVVVYLYVYLFGGAH